MGQGLNGALNNGSIPCFNNNSLVHIMGQGVSGPLNSDLMTDILNQFNVVNLPFPFPRENTLISPVSSIFWIAVLPTR